MTEKEMKDKCSNWRIHYFYLVIFFIGLLLFVFHVTPWKVNPEAYSNVSFAATIVSIILAVISIIYTLWSGKSSSDHLSSIKDIEEKIVEEINKFEDIDKTIKNAINPVQDCVGNIEAETKKHSEDLQRMTNMLSSSKLMNADAQTNTSNKVENLHSPFFDLVLVVTSECVKTKKPLPFNLFDETIEAGSWAYCMGVLECWETLCIIKSRSEKTNDGYELYIDSTDLKTKYNNFDKISNAVKNSDKYKSFADYFEDKDGDISPKSN